MNGATRVCGVGDLEVGEARRVDLAGRPVCLVRCADTYRAVADTCSHADVSLAEGLVDLEDLAIECWAHGSLFSLVTGEPNTFPATVPVEVFEVAVVGDDVLVRIPVHEGHGR